MNRLVVLALLLGSGSATAGDDIREPTRCEAVWIGPTRACGLTGTWAATGTGPHHARARQAAVDRLRNAVAAGAEVQIIKAAQTIAIGDAELDARRCPDAVVKQAQFSCNPDPMLGQKRLCYVDLPGTGCGDVLSFEWEGRAWKVMEGARDKLCSMVDRALQSAPDQARAECRAHCLQAARVRCPH